ncbi:hypothetical protein [Paratractidigestivibacter sp.]|uniref:hypothetical protein n=1 Tax=Paratractidigestivibacter sp. TaxID=2847316 RepID=UPI002AC9858D|nr:hypothetical protein [Paratractidigestivibacter sp.]
MDIVFSHITALEVYRTGVAPRPLAGASDGRALPDGAPPPSAVASWLDSSALGDALSRPVDLLAAEITSSSRRPDARIRAASDELPAGSILAIDEGASIVCPELMLLQMARTATFLELVLLVCEVCGVYAISPDSPTGMLQREAPLTSKAAILGLLDRTKGYRGSATLRKACSLAFDNSGSPMESKLAIRVFWPRRLGGYGIAVESLNEELDTGLAAKRIRKPDLLLRRPAEGALGVCVDYHGGVHEGPERHRIDDERMNELLALGMRPYVLWRQQYQSMRYMDELFDHQIRAELGLRTPRPTHARAAVELARRRALLAELNAIDGTRWGASQKGRTVQSALEEVERAEWELKQAEGR